jgi:AcrR family transcriptional regulator
VNVVAPALRTDARLNRDALVNAAREVFGQRGLDAPLDEIAHRAEVGSATLYRRFPTRCELVAAVFADRLADHLVALQQALANPDPWRGFCDHLEFMCQLQATDLGLADLLTMSVPGAPEIQRLRSLAQAGFSELSRRAQVAGALRRDFVPEDLVLLLMANAGLIQRTHRHAPQAWRRFLALMIDGLRADAASSCPPAPDADSLERSMRAQAKSMGCLGAADALRTRA